jgi:hypothetical protein
MRNDATGYWSKALGFGFDEPVTDDLIGRIVDFYTQEGSTGAVIQIAPSALPSNWEELRAKYGIALDSAWIKLSCPIQEFRPGRSDRGSAECMPTRPPNGRRSRCGVRDAWKRDLVGHAGGQRREPGLPALRCVDSEMVATANLFFVRGEIASLITGATLAGHQNQGARSALLAAHVKEAADAACRTLAAETGKPAEGAVNPSLNNMLRAGLQPLYARQNWVWRPAAVSPLS